MEPSIFNTSWIRDKWHCWKSRTKSERRNLSSIATIRIGWKVVSFFYGMLLLSAKYPRLLSWQTVKLLMKDDLENHSKVPNNSFWSNGWISPDFSTRSIKTSSIWQNKFYQESFLGMHRSRGEFGLEIFWLRIWKNWKIWTYQKFILGRINAKEVLISKRWEEFIFLVAGTAKL